MDPRTTSFSDGAAGDEVAELKPRAVQAASEEGLSAYQIAVRAREAARQGKTVAGESVGKALEDFLRKEGFPVNVVPPEGIACYRLEIEGELVEVYMLKGSLKIDGKLSHGWINLIKDGETMTQDTINSMVCGWISKRIAAQ